MVSAALCLSVLGRRWMWTPSYRFLPRLAELAVKSYRVGLTIPMGVLPLQRAPNIFCLINCQARDIMCLTWMMGLLFNAGWR